MSDEKIFRSGYVAIVGLPNVGKSTLLNKIIGEKVAITSSRPQTTRTSVQGIKTGEDYQIIFVDTPGFHSAKSHINRRMVSKATEALDVVDLIYLMTTPGEMIRNDFAKLVDLVKAAPQKKFLIINKVDAADRQVVYDTANRLFGLMEFAQVIPLSAKNGTNVDKLIELTAAEMPEGRAWYGADEVTTQPEKFLVAEHIREQVFRLVKEEIPYDTMVETETIEERKGGSMYIAASIIVNRESQKGVLIGKGGAMLKEIGAKSRESLESFFGVKVYLELWVKIRDNWSSKDSFLDIQGLG